MYLLKILSLAAIAITARGQVSPTIKVTVGAMGQLQFSPSNITADVGTNIEFSFFPKNHSVIQSSFSNPCHPLIDGFFSGFVPSKSSPSRTKFTITVKDKEPIWIYCGQTTSNHCQSGMVASINAPTIGNTLAAFLALAKCATRSTSPYSGAVGGYLSNNTTPNLATITPTSSLNPATFRNVATDIRSNIICSLVGIAIVTSILF